MKGLILGISVTAVSLASGGVLDNAWLEGTTDKTPLTYKPGEKMVFTVAPQDLGGRVPEGEYFLAWKRSGDDGLREEGKVAMTDRPFVYETKIASPGFVRLQVFVVDRDGKRYIRKFTGDATTPEGKVAMNRFERQSKLLFFDGGAGAGIESLTSHPEPSDFDAFWKGQYARLDLVPMKDDRIEVPCEDPKARMFAVRVDCAGLRPVTGYLTVPKAVENGKTFPARLVTHGYSGARCVHRRPGWERDNEIVFNVNAHGLKLVEFGATAADAKALLWEIRSHDPKAPYREYAFDVQQNADPEVAYFNGMVLRVKRALQYLKAQKGWNGKDLIASGWSQGGLQTIWAAACGEGVTRAESGITWCCDMYMNGKDRLNPELKLAADDWYIAWVDALGYYDAVNFAKRIPSTCRTIIPRAGLGDYCCPPTGLAKLWNNIPGNKEIHWYQGSQHGYVPPKPQQFVLRKK